MATLRHRMLSKPNTDPSFAHARATASSGYDPPTTATTTNKTSNDNNNSNTSSSPDSRPRPRPSKRLAPGLQQRVKQLEEQKRRREAEARRAHSIGRIPEEQLAELERLQRDRAVTEEVQRRGKIWSGPAVSVGLTLGTTAMPSGGVRLSGGPVLTDNEASMLESDVSSIIDISDHLIASETEDDRERDELYDTHKYRLPDIGKTRLHLRTREPLSPGPQPRPANPRETTSSPTPATPRSLSMAPANTQSPGKMDSPTEWQFRSSSVESSPYWHTRNSSLDNSSDATFTGHTRARAGSVYTLGRATFTGQLAQLTSMRLPDADHLARKISSMSSAMEAARALSDASEQIRKWISKASDVLAGLDAEDDAEWAAAGGREGIAHVDEAIGRFQRLVEIYIESIERLQIRDDISVLSAEDIRASVGQMEIIITSWRKIKDTLKSVKEQVEIAMDWERLWNTVLGEVAQELEALNGMVFEMEEKRHSGAESLLSSRDSIDLSELETIIEEQPRRGRMPVGSRLSIPLFSPSSSVQTPPCNTPIIKEDSGLLALFARMQPLRASLDFLPMRLSAWQIRGGPIFPSAWTDLEQRRDQLEAQWEKLEADAESLRRELGEDRWVMVFRNAGRQALKMCESISRSLSKLRDAIDTDEQVTNFPSLNTKIENYEQKKTHYGPAIERVLAIIDRGVLDRLTVNGEILRLQSEMKQRWTSLQAEMAVMDAVVEDINNEARERNLRDSVSTVISSERSLTSSLIETPGSSPASSVVGGSRKGSFGSRTPTPLTNIKTRNSNSNLKHRQSLTGSQQRRTLLSKSSFSERLSASPKTASSIPTPSKQPAWPSRPEPQLGNKPRWVQLVKNESRDFRPLSAFEPSPYAKTPVTPKTSYLKSVSKADGTPDPPIRTPALRITSAPTPAPPRALSRPTHMGTRPRKSSLPVPSQTSSQTSSGLSQKASVPNLRPSSRLASERRSGLLPPRFTDGNDADTESPSHHKRPPSALASGRRSSMLLAARPPSRVADSNSALTAAQDSKPKWRP